MTLVASLTKMPSLQHLLTYLGKITMSTAQMKYVLLLLLLLFIDISSGEEEESFTPKSKAESSKVVTKLPVLTKVKCKPSILPSDLELEPSKTEVIILAASGDSGPPAASGANSGLLAFTQSHWATCFISTLTNCLASALDPWDIGGGADIIVVFQGVIDKVYPDSHYWVKFGDKIYLMV